jgi:hypothetical protein
MGLGAVLPGFNIRVSAPLGGLNSWHLGRVFGASPLT